MYAKHWWVIVQYYWAHDGLCASIRMPFNVSHLFGTDRGFDEKLKGWTEIIGVNLMYACALNNIIGRQAPKTKSMFYLFLLREGIINTWLMRDYQILVKYECVQWSVHNCIHNWTCCEGFQVYTFCALGSFFFLFLPLYLAFRVRSDISHLTNGGFEIMISLLKPSNSTWLCLTFLSTERLRLPKFISIVFNLCFGGSRLMITL